MRGYGTTSWHQAIATPLVGRAKEMRALRSFLADAEAGQGRLVLIGGDAGIGKTRLVQELARTVDHHVSAILQKLGASNRRRATVIARELGVSV